MRRDTSVGYVFAPISPPAPSLSAGNFIPDAHVDYARVLTPEGGIAITYKDLDQRLRVLFARILLWSMASAIDFWLIFHHAPTHTAWVNIVLFIIALFLNLLIVSKAVEIYRTVEIRQDCMILDGAQLFWREKMEGGWPTFEPREDGVMVLTGIYGTRFVEYLTARRFDELDRSPEVLAAHLRGAMDQMWKRPL